MLTLQNYVIFTICQYNILCHLTYPFFTVYSYEIAAIGIHDHVHG